MNSANLAKKLTIKLFKSRSLSFKCPDYFIIIIQWKEISNSHTAAKARWLTLLAQKWIMPQPNNQDQVTADRSTMYNWRFSRLSRCLWDLLVHVVVRLRLYLVPLSVTDTEAVCMLSHLGNDTRTLSCMTTAINTPHVEVFRQEVAVTHCALHYLLCLSTTWSFRVISGYFAL